MNFLEDVLNCNNYVIELEQNSWKKRAGIYIRKDVKYVQRRQKLSLLIGQDLVFLLLAREMNC